MVAPVPTSRLLVAVALLGSLAAIAADAPKLKGSMQQSAPKLDLGLPKFTDIPKGEGLEKPKEKAPEQTRTNVASEPICSLVSLQHAKGFIRSPEGARPSAPYPAVIATGAPPTLEKFITMVRVKCTDKKSRGVEVVVLDGAGDTVMEASGELGFRAGAEADWQVEWEPTSVRRALNLSVLVRVGGEPLGTVPLPVSVK